jgi:hypothetical protein
MWAQHGVEEHIFVQQTSFVCTINLLQSRGSLLLCLYNKPTSIENHCILWLHELCSLELYMFLDPIRVIRSKLNFSLEYIYFSFPFDRE